MARLIMTLLGLGLLALAVWIGIIWWPELRIVLQATLVIVLGLLGLILTIFGISEISGARKPKMPGNE